MTYVLKFDYIPLIDCGEDNHTEFINDEFVIIFKSDKVLKDLIDYFIENIESSKMNPSFKENNYSFNRLYFIKPKETNEWNFEILLLEDYLKQL